jgi:hypothetical protein
MTEAAPANPSPPFRSRATTWLGVLLLAQTLLLAWSATRHGPSIDEVGHMAAGLHHWRTGNFDLYRVNPPLVRLVATAPLAAAGVRLPADELDFSPSGRPEFDIGRRFTSVEGERTFGYFTVARWACLPFAWLGMVVSFAWARSLYGPASGLLAAGLWSVCPNVLANAQLITPDTGAGALGLTAVYCFWRWLRRRSWGRAAVAGLVLGLAELCKATWVLLFLLYPVAWALYRRGDPTPRPRRGREALQLGAILGLGVYVLNLGYGFEDVGQRLGSFRFVSKTLSETDGANRRVNRFEGTPLADLPVPLPRPYVQGIDVQKSDFESGFRSYLRGEWRQRGWWYYYLYALAIKTPVGTLVLAAMAALAAAFGRRVADRRDEFVLLLPGVAVLAFVSSQTGFNHHLRYVFPAIPFLYVWVSRVAARGYSPGRLGAVVVAFAASAAGSLSVYPHSMSYFNALVGGPLKGSDHLVDSNIDWGQDLLHLKEWYEAHPEARPLGLAYFGYVDPRIAGLEFSIPPRGPVAPVDDEMPTAATRGPRPGWYAVSVTFLRGYHYSIPDGKGGSDYVNSPAFAYFQEAEPVARAGYSINIYHLSSADCDRIRRRLGMPPLPEAEAP